jgi:hypothetical protein
VSPASVEYARTGDSRHSCKSTPMSSAQALFQLFAHGRGGFQIRPGLEQVMPQIIALAGQRFVSPAHLAGLLLVLFGGFPHMLPGTIHLNQPAAFSRHVPVLELGPLGVVRGGGGIEFRAHLAPRRPSASKDPNALLLHATHRARARPRGPAQPSGKLSPGSAEGRRIREPSPRMRARCGTGRHGFASATEPPSSYPFRHPRHCNFSSTRWSAPPRMDRWCA